ncbi:MAG: aminoglycoside 6-adenylyltransferase [Ignavibacteriales bacterium]|nr:aminoglycoside 6-adenylyltransferase [Ignavibacteriales bacterium]
MHKEFVETVIEKIKQDENALGLAIGGSWITNDIDEFSDIDFVLVTKNKIAPDKEKMIKFVEQFGNLLNAFTGEHVGEKRLLVCLFDNPLLHVDVKFITTDEFHERVENPIVVWERENILTEIINNSEPKFPYPDFQWIEDRFWIWVHYVSTKLGRGELFEMLDGLNFLNTNVIAPLLQIKNGNLPKGFRRFEKLICANDLLRMKNALPSYDRNSLIKSFEEIISFYKDLRNELFTNHIKFQTRTEKRSLEYFEQIKKRI